MRGGVKHSSQDISSKIMSPCVKVDLVGINLLDQSVKFQSPKDPVEATFDGILISM